MTALTAYEVPVSEAPVGEIKRTQNEIDKILAAKFCESFDYEESEAWKFLQTIFGSVKLNQADLTRLADLVLFHLKPLYPELYFPREAARRKGPLVRWYQDYLHIIKPFIQEHIVIERQDGRLVGCERLQEMVEQCEKTNPPPKK